MNFYVVLEGDGYGPPVNFEDRNHAAEFCHQSGLPHFYEINPAKPMEPINVWHLTPGSGGKPFGLEPKHWADVVREHDGPVH